MGIYGATHMVVGWLVALTKVFTPQSMWRNVPRRQRRQSSRAGSGSGCQMPGTWAGSKVLACQVGVTQQQA